MDPPALSFRWMRDDDKRAVSALARRAFPPLGNVLFSPPPHTLVAERDGQVIGAVVPKLFMLSGGRQGGATFWLMTNPEVHGSGVGGELVEAALRFFEDHGCQEVFACVEGFNTSSSNLFAARGFSILSLGEQLSRYGLVGTLALWLKMHRFGGDVGHFLWARPKSTSPDSPALQWLVSVLASTLVFVLAGWRFGSLEGFNPAVILGLMLAILALFGLREAAMRLAARLQGLSVRHRAWESAFPLSVGIALTLGVFFPTPGSVYPRSGAWRYRDLVPKLGPTAFAGASAVLVFAWAMWVVMRFGMLPSEVAVWVRAAHAAGLSLALLDVLLPFSLFVSFSGRRVWDWNRLAWGVLAVAAAGLFLVR